MEPPVETSGILVPLVDAKIGAGRGGGGEWGPCDPRDRGNTKGQGSWTHRQGEEGPILTPRVVPEFLCLLFVFREEGRKRER